MTDTNDDLTDALRPSLKPQRRRRQPGLSRLQDVISSMSNTYANDRNPNRADDMHALIDEAFEIVLRLRSRRTR